MSVVDLENAADLKWAFVEFEATTALCKGIIMLCTCCRMRDTFDTLSGALDDIGSRTSHCFPYYEMLNIIHNFNNTFTVLSNGARVPRASVSDYSSIIYVSLYVKTTKTGSKYKLHNMELMRVNNVLLCESYDYMRNMLCANGLYEMLQIQPHMTTLYNCDLNNICQLHSGNIKLSRPNLDSMSAGTATQSSSTMEHINQLFRKALFDPSNVSLLESIIGRSIVSRTSKNVLQLIMTSHLEPITRLQTSQKQLIDNLRATIVIHRERITRLERDITRLMLLGKELRDMLNNATRVPMIVNGENGIRVRNGSTRLSVDAVDEMFMDMHILFDNGDYYDD